jgi:hypothetical protein
VFLDESESSNSDSSDSESAVAANNVPNRSFGSPTATIASSASANTPPAEPDSAARGRRKRKIIQTDDDRDGDSDSAAVTSSVDLQNEKDAEQERMGIVALSASPAAANTVGLQSPPPTPAAAVLPGTIPVRSPVVAQSVAFASTMRTASAANSICIVQQRIDEFGMHCTGWQLSIWVNVYVVVVRDRKSFFITGAAGTGKV